MNDSLVAHGLEVEVAIPCAAWIDACRDAEAIAAAAGRLTLARGLAGRSVLADQRVVIGIRLSGDREQRRLNHTYRGQDRSTNVLSFPLADLAEPGPPGSPLLLGDVVLAFETVRREADQQHKPVADHLRHLVVHGVLHLLGFDHESESEAEAMEGCEVEILAALGVPDPYGDTI